ncbi:MAG: hypothetical protein H7A08_09900 [Oceanospirillaceae bacterium]|nr:hypothetical protein [Oceanospirillaceae bacterium]MCP5350283.1 hypothetical protein [Oceanospirillaceae bacterium]
MSSQVNKLTRSDIASDIMREKLQTEIHKLEMQMERLRHTSSEHRFALMDTYRTMIETRKTLLLDMDRISDQQQA